MEGGAIDKKEVANGIISILMMSHIINLCQHGSYSMIIISRYKRANIY